MKSRAVDWSAVEASMRRSVHGRASVEDQERAESAFAADRERYRELSKRVREEEQEAYRRSGGLS